MRLNSLEPNTADESIRRWAAALKGRTARELYPNIGNQVSGIRHVFVIILSHRKLFPGKNLLHLMRSGAEGNTPALLVSVRNVRDAQMALSGGADVIDIKEPAHGPLGCADFEAIQEISAALRSFRAQGGLLTAALGELPELRDFDAAVRIAGCVDAVKVGLSQSTGTSWQDRWLELRDRLDATPLIAVVYADWESCGAPSPRDVLELAISSNSPGILFDTYHKNGRTLLDGLSKPELRQLIDELHSAARFAALAGSLNVAMLESICELSPAIVAVRSAVCRGGRNGTVDADLVAAFRAAARRALMPS